jgi:hypothetical protein
LGGEGLPSKCAGAGAEERSKGAAREIAANQQDQRTDLEVCKAWLFVVLYSSDGPLSQDGSPRFYLIKSTQKRAHRKWKLLIFIISFQKYSK